MLYKYNEELKALFLTVDNKCERESEKSYHAANSRTSQKKEQSLTWALS